VQGKRPLDFEVEETRGYTHRDQRKVLASIDCMAGLSDGCAAQLTIECAVSHSAINSSLVWHTPLPRQTCAFGTATSPCREDRASAVPLAALAPQVSLVLLRSSHHCHDHVQSHSFFVYLSPALSCMQTHSTAALQLLATTGGANKPAPSNGTVCTTQCDRMTAVKMQMTRRTRCVSVWREGVALMSACKSELA
jgi:hypothetical protein